MGIFKRISIRSYYQFFRYFIFFTFCILCSFFCLAMVAVADESDLVETTEISSTEYISSSMEHDPSPLHNNNSSSQLILIDFNTSIQTISADESSGFKAIILDLIGPYEMLTKEYTYTNPSNNYQSKQVTTEPDYSWMISAAIFIIVVYCFLRMLGGVICGRS